jgi:hypothetical protein
MKTIHLFQIGIFLAVVIATSQFYSCQNNSSSDLNHHKEDSETNIEVAELMFHNQRYMDKLYFAGKNQNWKLAEFYHHEMEENMEGLIENKVMEDEISLSDLAKSMFIPASEELKKSILAKDTASFKKGYDLTVRTCNNCHAASKHEFIQIIIPREPTFKNQQY